MMEPMQSADGLDAPPAEGNDSEQYVKLKTAAQFGNLSDMIGLVKENKLNPQLGDETGATPLHWAALNNRVACMHFLLNECGVDVEPANQHGVTPLHWAALTGHLEAACLLTNSGADVRRKDSMKYTPLIHAAQYGKTLMCHLLMLLGSIITDTDNNGHTSLHWAAYGGHVDTCRYLISRGADMTAQDENLMTPIHWAIVQNREYVAELFLELDKEGRTIEMTEHRGKTPLQLAVDHGKKVDCKTECGDAGCGSEHGNATDNAMVRKLKRLIWMTENRRSALYPWKQKFIYSVPIWLLPTFFFVLLPNMAVWLAVIVMMFLCAGMGRFLAVSDIRLDEKNPFAAFFYLSSFAMTYYIFFTIVMPNTLGHVFAHVSFFALSVLLVVFYYKACTVDPGVIRSQKEDEETLLKMAKEGQLSDRNYDFCSTCQIRKPLRSKHCRLCGHCVGRFDHHCPWMNGCLGFGNHPYFMGWAATEFAIHIVFLYLCVEALLSWPETPGTFLSFWYYLLSEHRTLGCFMMFHMGVCLMAFGLVYTHTRMLVNNVTSNELMGISKYSYTIQGGNGVFEYPTTLFSRSMVANAVDFFTNRVDWRRVYSFDEPVLRVPSNNPSMV